MICVQKNANRWIDRCILYNLYSDDGDSSRVFPRMIRFCCTSDDELRCSIRKNRSVYTIQYLHRIRGCFCAAKWNKQNKQKVMFTNSSESSGVATKLNGVWIYKSFRLPSFFYWWFVSVRSDDFSNLRICLNWIFSEIVYLRSFSMIAICGKFESANLVREKILFVG